MQKSALENTQQNVRNQRKTGLAMGGHPRLGRGWREKTFPAAGTACTTCATHVQDWDQLWDRVCKKNGVEWPREELETKGEGWSTTYGITLKAYTADVAPSPNPYTPHPRSHTLAPRLPHNTLHTNT